MIKHKIYELIKTGRIKIPRVLSATKVASGNICYEIENHGDKIFPKNGIIDYGNGYLCLGVKTLKKLIDEPPKHIIEIEEKIDGLNGLIKEYRNRLAEYNNEYESRVAFILAEEEVLNNEKILMIESLRKNKNASLA